MIWLKKSNQKGISIIEIMIAGIIGLLLILGITKIFLSCKQAYRMQDAQSRLQENARISLELLNQNIRLAGFLGCHSKSHSPKVIANPPLIAYPSPMISGGDDNTGSFANPNPALYAPLANGIIKGSDAITLQFGESCHAWTQQDLSGVDASSGLPPDNTCAINAGTPLVLSSCSNAHIFKQASDASLNTLNGMPTQSLGINYPKGSEILLFRSYTFYIRYNPNNQPALYRLDNNKDMIGNNPVELVEGVENMQILYGFDADNDASVNQYQEADQVADWSQIVSVRIDLTLRSIEDNLTSDPRTYSFDGSPEVTDRRLWKKFVTTIALRNLIN